MKDSTDMERQRGTSEELDPGTPDGRRKPGTETELDTHDQDLGTGNGSTEDDGENQDEDALTDEQVGGS
ncbi:MAG: hypothetical protein JO219_07090 [Candidatus Eremiobacteraeota bacterium]|nr:hypothetical protein [Candidatus Eremiobacteraeota bacterium]MBV8365529.1 hypothetical protein [Candidatus Eremiobacteraeota bacterium]